MWLSPHFEGILPELQSIPNWVLADPTKAPRQPNGQFANVVDPRTWSAFDQVRAAYKPDRHIGVGFVLDGKAYFSGKYLHGFDWDRCIDADSIDPTVKAHVKGLGISRLELSVSGTGLRGFFLHHEALPSRQTRIEGRSVELYSSNRYLITTGWAFPGCEVLT